MIGVVATIRVKEGGGQGFETVFRALAGEVRANEPGNIVYDLFRSRTEPNCFKVLEIYRDSEAQAAHSQSEHFKRLVPGMGPFLEGRPEVEYLDGID
jgi:quinol monooxygenase YgiN